MASTKFSLKDRGRSQSADFVTSASSRMQKVQQKMDVSEEMADEPAMSMSDLLASLENQDFDDEPEYSMEGTLAAHILQFSNNIGITMNEKIEERKGNSVSLRCQVDHLIIEDDSGTYQTDER
jgi:hypothetical protein